MILSPMFPILFKNGIVLFLWLCHFISVVFVLLTLISFELCQLTFNNFIISSLISDPSSQSFLFQSSSPVLISLSVQRIICVFFFFGFVSFPVVILLMRILCKLCTPLFKRITSVHLLNYTCILYHDRLGCLESHYAILRAIPREEL